MKQLGLTSWPSALVAFKRETFWSIVEPLTHYTYSKFDKQPHHSRNVFENEIFKNKIMKNLLNIFFLFWTQSLFIEIFMINEGD